MTIMVITMKRCDDMIIFNEKYAMDIVGHNSIQFIKYYETKCCCFLFLVVQIIFSIL